MWRKDKYYVLHGMTLNWWFTFEGSVVYFNICVWKYRIVNLDLIYFVRRVQRKYSVIRVLPISDFMSTLVGGGIFCLFGSISDTSSSLSVSILTERDHHVVIKNQMIFSMHPPTLREEACVNPL